MKMIDDKYNNDAPKRKRDTFTTLKDDIYLIAICLNCLYVTLNSETVRTLIKSYELEVRKRMLSLAS